MHINLQNQFVKTIERVFRFKRINEIRVLFQILFSSNQTILLYKWKRPE